MTPAETLARMAELAAAPPAPELRILRRDGGGTFAHRHEGHELRIRLAPADRRILLIEIVLPGIRHAELSLEAHRRAHVLQLREGGCELRHHCDDPFFVDSPYRKALLRMLEKLRAEPHPDAAAARECTLVLALFYLRAELQSPPDSRTGRVKRLIQRMESEYYRPDLSIAELARRTGYSPHYIQPHFRAATGMTPKAYLVHVRLAAAARFLCEKRYLVKEVAAMCGFSGARHFSETFRRHYGCPPGDFAEKADRELAKNIRGKYISPYSIHEGTS